MSLQGFLSSRYDTDTFESFIRERFYGLDIYDSAHTDDYLSETEKKSIDSYRFLGKAELDDGKEIGFFEFRSRTTQIENKRVGYNAILKKLASDEILDGAIASFYHPDGSVWRLSFVGFEYDEGRAKVTNLKRYTYVLGEGIPIKTPLAQLKNLKYPTQHELEEAFSVEAVTDEFYKSYKALFESINQELEPQAALFVGKDDPEVEIRKFSRKLLGRITFMYFLQKKGWLGVKQHWGDGDRNFLQETLYACEGNFYDERLIPLFFTALNSMREDDHFALLDCKIPFLNGGLFTRESYDHHEVYLSNELFEKIFETFNQYNFTIIEDLPHDSEVAIDPEMLGRVFENLIEENYRKGKGAFYTPREIVHYMCKQSIIMYLSNHFDKEPMEQLVNDEVTDDTYIKKHATDIKERLLQMKVLDPAIGSGAFPMGILHEMVQIIGNLNKAENTSKEKKLIIENSIYGVDIDGSAVDIAKLRFWLSIIVDEEEPFPLPNLAFKIMQGNSLIETIDGFSPIPEDIYTQTEAKQISLFDEEHTLFDQTKFDRLRENIHVFYNASDPKKKERLQHTIQDEVKEIIVGYIDAKEVELQKREMDFAGRLDKGREKIWNEIIRLKDTITKARKIINEMLENNFQTTELFLYKLWFGEVIKEGGFDVIIGNPPYLRVQGIDREISEEYKSLYTSATGSYDLYVLFVEKGLSLLRDKGILNYIMPHKWVNSSFGKGLRSYVKEYMKQFISFDAYQVFNASTYTSLLWLTKEKNELLNYVELDRDLQTNIELEKYLSGLNKNDYTPISTNELSSDAWILTDKETYKILERLKQQPLQVKDIFEKIFTGLQTSKDSIYFLKNCTLDNNIITGYSEELQRDVEVEKDFVKPLLKGDGVHKYEPLQSDKVVIFPYNVIIENNKEQALLYTEDEISKQFPKGYLYLKECEKILRDRERGKFNIEGEWFQYGRKQGITSANKEKLIQPDISMGGNFSYDKEGKFFQTATLYGYIKYLHIEESYRFYMSLLNSKLLWWYLTKTGTVLTNNYFRFKPDYINPFPIPKIENLEDTKPFEILVDYITWLKANDATIDSCVDNEHIAKLFEDVIDAMVLELYFKDEMKEAGFDFITHATKLFKPIENLSDSQTKDIINNAYQSLREKDNPIRNDLQLLPIRVPIVAPILESI